MGIVLTDNKHYKDIAQAIRDNKELMGQLFPSEMADAINQACAENYTKGKQEEHNLMWNSIQNHDNGATANYAYKFRAWKREAFYPIKNIKPTTVEYMFAFFEQNSAIPFNLKDRLNECNVTLDTSSCTTFNFGFYFTSFSELPHINMSSLTNASYTFAYNTYLKKIEKITVNENAKWTNAFDNDTALEEVYFDGKIGNNISFASSSLLTSDSIDSIINALKQDAGKVLTLNSVVKQTFRK